MTLIPQGQNRTEELSKRSISAGSMTTQLPTTSSADEFIDAKIERPAADIAMGNELNEILGITQKRKARNASEYKISSRQVNLR